MFENFTVFAAFIAAVGTIVSGLFALDSRSSARIGSVHQKVDELENAVLTKFENHEQQDAQRFSSVSDGIWDLRVRMAAKEGMTAIPHAKD